MTPDAVSDEKLAEARRLEQERRVEAIKAANSPLAIFNLVRKHRNGYGNGTGPTADVLAAAVSAATGEPGAPGLSDEEFEQLLRAAIDENWIRREREVRLQTPSSVIKSRVQQIDNLHSFILSEAPYGMVEPDRIQNIVTYDGPLLPDNAALPRELKRPPLYWYFNGYPYRIVRALTFLYQYTVADASGQYPQNDCIYVGIEGRLNEVGAYAGDQGSDQSPLQWGDEEPRCVQVSIADEPDKVGRRIYNDLTSLGFNNFQHRQSGWVDFAGPARDGTANNPYPLTIYQLVERREEFAKLLYFPIGGKPQRVAKAMRIQVVDDDISLRSILIGFQGMGGTGPG